MILRHACSFFSPVLFCLSGFAAQKSFRSVIGLAEPTESVSCEALSDSYCEAFWSAENLGNFTFSDGQKILGGERKKTLITHKKYIYLKKMADSRCRYSEELQAGFGIDCSPKGSSDVFTDLSELLAKIESFPAGQRAIDLWLRALDKIELRISEAFVDMATEKLYREKPSLQEKLWADFEPKEIRAFNKNYYDLINEMADTVYLKDPDWLRVVRVFEEARLDALKIISIMNIDDAIKTKMTVKLGKVELSLPYRDPRRTGLSKECGIDDDNAIYIPTLNVFTVCLGMVNSSLHDGALYGVVAHEMAHAVDPGSLSDDVYTESPLAKLLGKVYSSNSTLSCEEWDRSKAMLFEPPKDFYTLPSGISELSECLVDTSTLDDITPESLSYASQRSSEASLSSVASRQIFTYLTTPKILKDGVLELNKFFLKPKEYSESKNAYFAEKSWPKGYFHNAAVFIQDYKCELEESKNEDVAFAKALKETLVLRRSYEYIYSATLMREAAGLKDYNLAKPSNEDFADWMSNKVTELKLSREISVEKKREFILAGTAMFCQPSGIAVVAKQKALIESRYSRSAHPPSRKRRLSKFTSGVANLVQCERGEDILALDKSCDAEIIDLQLQGPQ